MSREVQPTPRDVHATPRDVSVHVSRGSGDTSRCIGPCLARFSRHLARYRSMPREVQPTPLEVSVHVSGGVRPAKHDSFFRSRDPKRVLATFMDQERRSAPPAQALRQARCRDPRRIRAHHGHAWRPSTAPTRTASRGASRTPRRPSTRRTSRRTRRSSLLRRLTTDPRLRPTHAVNELREITWEGRRSVRRCARCAPSRGTSPSRGAGAGARPSRRRRPLPRASRPVAHLRDPRGRRGFAG